MRSCSNQRIVDNRQYPARPIASALAVVRRGGRVLLVRRGRPPNQGRWGFPGGVQELGETIEQAAIRELQEETGLVGRDACAFAALNVIDRDGNNAIRHHYILIAVALRCDDEHVAAASDAAAVAWFSTEDLADSKILPDVGRILTLLDTLPQY